MSTAENRAPIGGAAVANSDEESTYVYLDLSDVSEDLMPSVGSTVSLQGLDTESPQLVNSRGVRLSGQYEESLGSLLFFLLQKQRQDAVGLAAASAQQQPHALSTGGGSAAALDLQQHQNTARAVASAQQQPNGATNGVVSAAALPLRQPTAHSNGAAAAQGSAPAVETGSSSQQGPTHAGGSSKPPKSGAGKALGSKAVFLSQTDTVLRFRKA